MKINRLLLFCAVFAFGYSFNARAQVKIIETIAGGGSTLGDGGPATAAKLSAPCGYALDVAGNKLYIADQSANRIRVINLNTGIINTAAGNGTATFAGDGVAATASTVSLSGPTSIAIDAAGNLYIADAGNNRIRKITAATGFISTIAGNGTPGYAGDGGPATASGAMIGNPRGVAVDAVGNIYFSDPGLFGSTNHVRKIDLSGNLSTIAGNGTGGYSGEGTPATNYKLNAPRGVITDASGNVYIADMTNNRVRMVTPGLTISTYAGNGTLGSLGDGTLAAGPTAELDAPSGVNFDNLGNLIISDAGNNKIRMVTTATGIISTIAGTGTAGFSGDGGPATAAKIDGAVNVAFTANGSYYIFDKINVRIREVRNDYVPTFTGGTRQNISFCQGSGPFVLNSTLAVVDTDALQTITWSKITSPGPWVTSGTLTTFPTAMLTVSGTTPLTPSGLVYTPTITSGMDSFVIQVSDGYMTSTDTIIVTINPLPVVPGITGASSVCETANITLSDATSGGTDVWTSSSANVNITSSGNTATITGVLAGTTTITYSVTSAAGCGPITTTYPLTINPQPVSGSVSGPSQICIIASGMMLADVGGMAGTWSSGTTTIAAIDPSTGGITPALAGTDVMSYIVTNVCGTSTANYTVTIVPLPVAGAITGTTTNVCAGGATISLTDATGMSGGTWSTLFGNATVAATGTVTGVTAGSDVVSYTFSNLCGSDYATQAVTILPLPDAGTITGPTTNVCVAGTLSLTDASPSGTWSESTGNASVVGGLVSGISAGADAITYAVTNSCGTANALYSINVVTTPSAGTITGATSVCVSATVNMSDAVGSGVWTESTGKVSVSSAGVVTGLSAGTDLLTYTVTYSCGVASATYGMTVNPLADAGTITGSLNLCIGGSPVTLSDIAAGGVWTSSNTSVATVSGGVVSSVALGVANILYSVTNICGTTSALQTVTVNTVVTPKVSYTATSGVGFTSCAGTLVTFSALPVNGGSSPSYQWSVNGTVVGAGATYSYAPANGDVVLCTMTSSMPCVTSATSSYSKTMVVNPVLTPSVTISSGIYTDTVCTGLTPVFTPTSANGGTTPIYDWYVNGTYVATGPTYSRTMVAPFDNGDVISCVLTTSYVCPSSPTAASNNITMTVDALFSEVPKISVTTNPGNAVCSLTPVSFIASTLYGGITPLLRWTKNGVNVATGPTYTYYPSNGDIVHCMLESSSGCLVSPSLDSIFTPDIVMSVLNEASPHVSISAPLGTAVGAGESLTLTATVTNPTISMTYQWQQNGVNVPGATNNTYTFNQATPGTTIVTCVVSSGDVCNYSSISNLLSLTVFNLGVTQQEANSGNIRLMPNPNKGSFTIEGTLSIDNKQVTLEVMDVVGQVVYKNIALLQNGILNTSVNMNKELANGMYLLHIMSEDQHLVIRFSVDK